MARKKQAREKQDRENTIYMYRLDELPGLKPLEPAVQEILAQVDEDHAAMFNSEKISFYRIGRELYMDLPGGHYMHAGVTLSEKGEHYADSLANEDS